MLDSKSGMDKREQRVHEVLHNLNWLLEFHKSSVTLVEIKGRKVVIRCEGACADCEMDCIGAAFKERMPDIELLRV